MQNGRRVPDGEEVAGYFPKIVPEDLFWRAQGAVGERLRNDVRGAKGRSYSNLLSGLAKCAKCGGSVVHQNKGRPPKGGQYLVCSNAARGLCTNHRHQPYNKLETTLLAYLSTEDISRFIAKPEIEIGLGGALEAEIEQKKERMRHLAEHGDIHPMFGEVLRQLAAELKKLEQQLADHRRDANVLKAEAGHDAHAEFIQLMEQMQAGNILSDDLYLLRSKLARQLRRLVEKAILDDGMLTVCFQKLPNGRQIRLRVRGSGETEATIWPHDDAVRAMITKLRSELSELHSDVGPSPPGVREEAPQ
jgi:hypothetical protein